MMNMMNMFVCVVWCQSVYVMLPICYKNACCICVVAAPHTKQCEEINLHNNEVKLCDYLIGMRVLWCALFYIYNKRLDSIANDADWYYTVRTLLYTHTHTHTYYCYLIVSIINIWLADIHITCILHVREQTIYKIKYVWAERIRL